MPPSLTQYLTITLGSRPICIRVNNISPCSPCSLQPPCPTPAAYLHACSHSHMQLHLPLTSGHHYSSSPNPHTSINKSAATNKECGPD